jgi:hypothetical protein
MKQAMRIISNASIINTIYTIKNQMALAGLFLNNIIPNLKTTNLQNITTNFSPAFSKKAALKPPIFKPFTNQQKLVKNSLK